MIDLVEKFDEISSSVSKKMLEKSINKIDKNAFVFKGLLIEKQHNDLYQIKINGEALYSDVFLFSSSLLLSEALYNGRTNDLKEIIHLDNRYSSLCAEMSFAKNAKRWDMFENYKTEALGILTYLHNRILKNL